jgi:O-antigen ligase/polysaccharide polymerase Wzy-like membrane protein
MAALRRGLALPSHLILLGGPTAIAFFSGGYFDEARAWAGLISWILVLVALIELRALPRGRGIWMALGALVLLGAWTLASMAWAPIPDAAYHACQLVFLYAGALLATTLLLRGGRAQPLVEPALLFGALIVIGYGLSERLLPGLLHFARSLSAQGRLEQPLTYWNAMGELAAIGLVLAARVSADDTRPAALRALATAAAAPLGMGLYLSFSRGAVVACLIGLLVLLAAAARREQLASILLTLAAAGLGALSAAPFHGLASLTGTLPTRELQGGIALVALLMIMTAAATAQITMTGRMEGGRLSLPRRSTAVALALGCLALAAVIFVGGAEGTSRQVATQASRFVTLGSNRYAFWSVALHAFSAQPLHGVGAGSWQVWWLRYRPFAGFARDAHSLPLQTAAELGLIGLALLLAFFSGVVRSARAALRFEPRRAAGPLAGFVVYAAHAPLDWDWQMPAVTLVGLVLAGSLLALAVAPSPRRDPAQPARTGGTRRKKLRNARFHVFGEPGAARARAYHAAAFSGSRPTTRFRIRRAPRKSP